MNQAREDAVEHDERPDRFDEDLGISRRTLMKRGAVVGGVLVWSTPVLQSLVRPAFASGSGPCQQQYRFKVNSEGGSFDNGQIIGTGNACCVPDGYNELASTVGSDGTIPTGGGSVAVSFDGNTATVTLPATMDLTSAKAKAGSCVNETIECADFGRPSIGGGGVKTYTVALTKNVSYVAGVICVH